jgi:DNA repair exonuclease SbcCD ATPase subunit
MAGEAQSVGLEGKRVQGEVARLEAEAQLYERAAGVLNSLGEQRQDEAQRQIESLVTRGLQVVFGEELSFHLVSRQERGAATVDFIVRTTLEDGTTVDTAIMDARGGGLAAVVGFLLRLVVMLLEQRTTTRDRLMVLDESFAMVSAEYLPRVSEFVRELVDKTGVQMIMVTHQDIFAENADVVYRFTLSKDGATRAVEEG